MILDDACMAIYIATTLLLRATYTGAPSCGGMRTWVEGSQARGNCTMAEASNLLGYKELYRLYLLLKENTTAEYYTQIQLKGHN